MRFFRLGVALVVYSGRFRVYLGSLFHSASVSDIMKRSPAASPKSFQDTFAILRTSLPEPEGAI